MHFLKLKFKCKKVKKNWRFGIPASALIAHTAPPSTTALNTTAECSVATRSHRPYHSHRPRFFVPMDRKHSEKRNPRTSAYNSVVIVVVYDLRVENDLSSRHCVAIISPERGSTQRTQETEQAAKDGSRQTNERQLARSKAKRAPILHHPHQMDLLIYH